MMIGPADVETTDAPPGNDPRWTQMHCASCRGRLPRMILQPGSFVEDRCHHTVVGPDGKRRTCGYVTRTGPTR